jgi:ribosome biogenesis protein SSF1/2
MLPNTAKNLDVKRTNKLKDFLGVAAPLGITHFIVATSSTVGSHLRFMRVPRGPTLTFRLHEYSLVNDVIAVRRRPVTPSNTTYLNPPLMVLNNFTDTTRKEVALMAVAFQNMFPVINVGKVPFIFIFFLLSLHRCFRTHGRKKRG